MCYTFSLTRVPESAASALQDSYKSVFATEKMSVLIILSDALTSNITIKTIFFSHQCPSRERRLCFTGFL